MSARKGGEGGRVREKMFFFRALRNCIQRMFQQKVK